MSETKFTRKYLHEQLWQLRESFGTEEFWSKPNAVETANKAIWFVYFQTESPTDFDKLRVEATLDELTKRWEYIKLLKPYAPIEER